MKRLSAGSASGPSRLGLVPCRRRVDDVESWSALGECGVPFGVDNGPKGNRRSPTDANNTRSVPWFQGRTHMSVAGLRYALTVPKLTSSERLLFIVIADAVKGDATFASQAWFAKRTGLCLRTVRSAMKGLEAKGHIERKPRYSEGQRTSDLIVARLPSRGEKLPAKSAARKRQNVPSNPYSPYGVVEEKEKRARQDGLTGEVIAFPQGGARGQHTAPAGKQTSSFSDLHDIQSYLEVPLS